MFYVVIGGVVVPVRNEKERMDAIEQNREFHKNYGHR